MAERRRSEASRPRLLDLFCGAGGAAMGYHRAGFDVVGVDIQPQPNYPFEFFEEDALDFLRDGITAQDGGYYGAAWLASFDVIHASPPCQFTTAYKRRPDHVGESPNLIPRTRELLKESCCPYWVIENIEGAREHLRDSIRLCGSSFGLDVRRHRLFECFGFEVDAPACDHSWQTPRFAPASNRTNLRSTVEVGVWRISLDVQQRAMGIDWMALEELSEAIPPAYTEHIGGYLAAALRAQGGGSVTEGRRSEDSAVVADTHTGRGRNGA